MTEIQVRNLSCGYNGKVVINNISFNVKSGEICCILGPNGAGKTTLFKTMLQIMQPLSGSVCINGENITKWSPKKISGYLAYVSQYHVPPFPYIVEDVIMLGRISSTGYFGKPTKQDYNIVNETMNLMGISYLKEKAYTDISGGERQLVMIARAMAQQPDFLILDEPTASLDYGNTLKVLREIKRLQQQGYGIIMTTHSPDQAFLCNSNVVLLSKEYPPVFGTAAEVINNRNLRNAYGEDIRVVQFKGRKGGMVRVCAPEL